MCYKIILINVYLCIW